MSVTTETIELWFNSGVDNGSRWMVVVCDTYDWSDYPVFFTEDEKDKCVERIASALRGDNMQKLMEVYDLDMDMGIQLTYTKQVMNGPT